MKTNEEIIDAFLENKEEENVNLYSYGDKLVYCTTTIAQRIEGCIIINISNYTTYILENIQAPLIVQINYHKYNHICANYIPYETKDLKPYI